MSENILADKIISYLQQEETNYTEAAKLGEEAMPILKKIIMGGDVALASKAASLAGMINSDQQTDVLTQAANHPSTIVRIAAAAATQQMHADKALPVLQQLIDDGDIGVSKYTLQSIQAKNLSASFKSKLEHISNNNQEESIKVMAREALKGNN